MIIFSSCSVVTGSVVFGRLESPPSTQIFLLSWLLRDVGSLTLVQLLYWPPPPPFSKIESMATLLETEKVESCPAAVLIHAVSQVVGGGWGGTGFVRIFLALKPWGGWEVGGGVEGRG